VVKVHCSSTVGGRAESLILAAPNTVGPAPDSRGSRASVESTRGLAPVFLSAGESLEWQDLAAFCVDWTHCRARARDNHQVPPFFADRHVLEVDNTLFYPARRPATHNTAIQHYLTRLMVVSSRSRYICIPRPNTRMKRLFGG